MTEVMKALYSFFSGFSIPAYEENSVPDDAALPYITYHVSVPDWNDTADISANIWYSGPYFTDVSAKADEIGKYIDNGTLYPDPACLTDEQKKENAKPVLYIYKGTPFAQVVPTGDDNVKVIYLNIGIHAFA